MFILAILIWEIGSFVLDNFYLRKWTFAYVCNMFYTQLFMDYLFPNTAGNAVKFIAGIVGLFMILYSIIVHAFLDWLPLYCTLVLLSELNGFNNMVKNATNIYEIYKVKNITF